jgi:hypothetical protein
VVPRLVQVQDFHRRHPLLRYTTSGHFIAGSRYGWTSLRRQVIRKLVSMEMIVS